MNIRGTILRCAAALAIGATHAAHAQMPKQPKNLQVLPKDLTTDSVFKIMLDVANGLGVTCGSCHPGGDNPTWDSTNFSGDVKPMKATAREMFRLVNRLNGELLPAIVPGGVATVPVTCMTCHRGARRPLTIQDTINTVIERQGLDSALTVYRRIREKYSGRMTFDLTYYPLTEIAGRLMREKRFPEAVRLLEFDGELFPGSDQVARALTRARAAAAKPPPHR